MNPYPKFGQVRIDERIMKLAVDDTMIYIMVQQQDGVLVNLLNRGINIKVAKALVKELQQIFTDIENLELLEKDMDS